MPHRKFLRQALKIIKENPRVFEALAEYDRTRRLPKTVYRERINLTIDANILKKFRRHAREKGLNMSRVMEKYMLEELRK